MKLSHSLPMLLIALAGCSQKPAATPIVVPAVPRPFVEITPVARRVLVQVAADQKFGGDWWVRLHVAWKPDPQIEVTVERTPPGPADVVHEADGLRVVMAGDQTVYLKGAQVDLVQVEKGAAFDVTFPYRTDRDRELANHWLVEQAARKRQ